jgi:NitT/TauT family transport system ATP-binding protein/nitrate/nitrite transport system substrate-binding protein
MVTGLALGRGDNGIVLGDRLGAGPIADQIAGSVTPPTFAVVFPYSVHTYLVRLWLARHGVDPDRDVRIIVVPPPQMPQMLATGRIDGFCAGAPWPAVAAARGAGRIVATGAEIAPTAPDKVLAVTAAWADQHPATHQALIRAVIRAGLWADDPANRADLIELLADPDAVGVDADLLHPEAQPFHRHALPDPADAAWLIDQMRAAGHLTDAGSAAAIYRPDLYRQAADSLGLPV